MYQHLKIYYFSGTGNALSATNWILEKAKNKGIEFEKINIEEISENIDPDQIPKNTLIGFCYPTHGFGAPWIILHFLLKFPKLKSNYFLLNTRAGFKMGFYGFGITGFAHIIPMIILKFKGLSCKGLMPLDMPHNWTSFFFPNFKSSIPKITNHCKRQIDRVSEKLLNEKSYFRPQIWFTLPFDLLLLPITLAYLLQGRFVLAKTLFASYTCNNCKLCERYCPVNAIEIRNGRPYWKITCESCMRCMNICPQKSIQSNVTRMSAVLYATYLLLSFWIAINGLFYFLVILPVFFLIFYQIFWYLLAFRAFNKVLTFTSLTRYWGRYLAMGVDVKDFKTKKTKEVKK